MKSTTLAILTILTLVGGAMGQESILQPTPPATAAPAESPKPTPAKPASNPEAKMILEACAQAIRQAHAITYRASHRVEGSLASMMGSQSGQVTLVRNDAGTLDMRLTGTDIDSKKTETAFDIAYHGPTVEWLDPDARKLLERPINDPQTRNKRIQASKFLRNDELLKPEPFQSLDNATITLVGTETIDGVICDVVELDNGPKKTKWFIATTDRFPRRITIVMPGGNGELTLNLSNVTIGTNNPPALSPQATRIPLPSGYEEDRRTAPPPPPVHTQTPAPHEAPKHNQPTIPAPVKPAPTPELPKAAPDFELPIARGPNGEPAEGTVKLADLAGSVAVLDFFGSWTLAAPAWHAELDALHADFAPRGVKFYCLNVREKNIDAALSMMNQAKNAPALLASADAVARSFGVRAYPATVVINKDGTIAEFIQGSREGGESKARIKAAIERAMGDAAASTTVPAAAPSKDAPASAPESPKPEAPADPSKTEPEAMPTPTPAPK